MITKTKLNILFVGTILSFFPFSMILVSTAMDVEMNDFVACTWMMYFALPVPLLGIIFGFIAKKYGIKSTKNIIAGFICSALILLFGSFSFIMQDFYSRDYARVFRIEETINFELPHSGKIYTQIFGSKNIDSEVEIDSIESRVKFTSPSEITDFNERIAKSSLWETHVSTHNKGLLPVSYTYAKYDYYMIYCIEADLYNCPPDSSGEYNFIFLGYDLNKNLLLIGEYSLQIQI